VGGHIFYISAGATNFIFPPTHFWIGHNGASCIKYALLILFKSHKAKRSIT
jgi:hypothetical protein